jgi:GT2 family glycosyltransferase/tetratricopeptide (TPR) repeat protein
MSHLVFVRLRRLYYKLRFEIVEKLPAFKESMAAGHNAKKRGDWAAALECFGLAAQARPDSVGARLQQGHAFKELGRLTEAEAAYRSAVKLQPDSVDPHIHLGHALKLLGRRAEAADSYSRAIGVAPRDEVARNELVALGSREKLGTDQYGDAAITKGILSVSDEVDLLKVAVRDLSRAAIFPPQAWQDFRRAFPPSPPPLLGGNNRLICVVIDARGARPSYVRASLTSLLDQSLSGWRALVLADANVITHSVGSFEKVDSRIRFFDGSKQDWGTEDILMLQAGVVLDSFALARFSDAAGGEPVALYADHDHCVNLSGGITAHWRWPVLQDAPGTYDLRSNPIPPVLCYSVAPHSNRTIDLISSGNLDPRRHLLDRLEVGEPVAHIPMVLASRLVEAGADRPQTVDSLPPQPGSLPANEFRIRVIIPTRDQGGLLESCIRSLEATAVRPDLISIVIMDNRSVEPNTQTLLGELEAQGSVQVLLADEPFNWSRLNNLGVKGAREEILVFANNDLEMLSAGWDDRLRVLLGDEKVGAVGARLLYPDFTLQHVGIVLGAISGRPIHEGRGAGPTENGPLSRWRRTREASAVTGAFLAVRNSVFSQVGGFNERLSIAYNDVDFCLRVRKAGLSVIFASEIEAIHHESKTRGYANAQEKVAWDDAEFRDLCGIWGEQALIDPIVNPQWTFAEERSFDGLRPSPRSLALRRSSQGPL